MSPLLAQVVLAVLSALAEHCSEQRAECIRTSWERPEGGWARDAWQSAAAVWFDDMMTIQATARDFEHEVAQDWEWQGGRVEDFKPHGTKVYRYDDGDARLAALDDDDADHDGLFAAPWPQK